MKYVALLRGINLGGHNKLPMKDLTAIFVAAGCNDVKTYIQSGNVVFSAPASAVKRLPDAITAAIEKKFGYKIPVVMRSADEVARAANANPFLTTVSDHKTLHLGFLLHEPKAEAVAGLDPNKSPGDAYQVVGREVYFHTPNGFGQTKLTSAYFDSRLKTVITSRNWATVQQILAMLSE